MVSNYLLFGNMTLTLFLGDSRKLYSKPPVEFMNKLQLWLKESFGHQFADTGDSLTHAVQMDVSSCAICTENTVAHEVMGDTLWTQDCQAISRINWFCTLSQACLETKIEVGIHVYLYNTLTDDLCM